MDMDNCIFLWGKLQEESNDKRVFSSEPRVSRYLTHHIVTSWKIQLPAFTRPAILRYLTLAWSAGHFYNFLQRAFIAVVLACEDLFPC